MSDANNDQKNDIPEKVEQEDAPPAAEDGRAPVEAQPATGRPGSRRETGPEHHHRPKKKELEGEMEEVRRERDELKDKYLRALADIDNQRKRFEKDKSEFFQFALADMLKDFLGVLDSLERALAADDQTDGQSFQEGVRMIHKQFLDALAKKGVTPILDVAGSAFDPNLHQALTTEESGEVKEPLVAEEMQRGYRLHDRLLRPALVKVRVPQKGA